MRSYPVKENPFGSAVSEILCYKQTNRQTDIVLLCIIDYCLGAATIVFRVIFKIGVVVTTVQPNFINLNSS